MTAALARTIPRILRAALACLTAAGNRAGAERAAAFFDEILGLPTAD